MKIERMIGILSVLLQKEKITAPELAEMFEVSGRTINRDVEALCKAGIPISTSQGVNGGISIMEGFWWQEDSEKIDYNRKEDFCWISLIRLPDFVTKEDFQNIKKGNGAEKEAG